MQVGGYIICLLASLISFVSLLQRIVLNVISCSCRGQDATGEEVIKPYTPTTLDSDLGRFELVIKVKFHKYVPF